MHWTYKTGLGAAAFLLVNSGIAAPKQAVVQGQATAPAVAQDSRLDKRVSVKFDNVPLKEVLSWLGSQGVNFVVRDEAGESHLTMNIVDQPLKDAVSAIADVMGGRWVRRGEVYSFQPGGPFNFIGPDVKGFAFDEDAMKELKMLPKMFSDQDLKELKALPDMKEFNKDFMKDFKVVIPDMKDFHMSEKDAQKLRDELRTEMKLVIPKIQELKELKMSDKDKQKLRNDIKIELKPLQDLKELKNLKTLRIDGNQDIEKLMGSISKAQWDKHAKQGYLKLSDLTPEQRKMLGQNDLKGTWELSYSINGKSLKIKNG